MHDTTEVDESVNDTTASVEKVDETTTSSVEETTGEVEQPRTGGTRLAQYTSIVPEICKDLDGIH